MNGFPWWIPCVMFVLSIYIFKRSAWYERNQDVTIGEFIDRAKRFIKEVLP